MSLALTVQVEERIQFPAGFKDKMLNYLNLDRTQNDDQVIRLFAAKETLAASLAGLRAPPGGRARHGQFDRFSIIHRWC